MEKRTHLRISSMTSKNWPFRFLRSNSFCAQRDKGNKCYNLLYTRLGILLLCMQIDSRPTCACCGCIKGKLTRRTLFWNSDAIWPCLSVCTNSFAVCCGDISSTLLMNLYSFWKRKRAITSYARTYTGTPPVTARKRMCILYSFNYASSSVIIIIPTRPRRLKTQTR